MEENAVIAQVVFSLSLDRDFESVVFNLKISDPRAVFRPDFYVMDRASAHALSATGFFLETDDQWHTVCIPRQRFGNDGGGIDPTKAEIMSLRFFMHAVRTLLPAVVRSGEMKHKQALFVSLTLKAANQGAEFDKMSDKRKELIQYLRREGSRPLTELVNLNLASTAIISKMCEETVARSWMDALVVCGPRRYGSVIQNDGETGH